MKRAIEPKKTPKIIPRSEKAVSIQGVLANPSNRDLNCTVEFCVDTGANITVIPRKIAKKLKLKKSGTAQIQLADGRVVENDLAYVYLYVADEGVMLFAAITEDGEPLLGTDVMELLQFQIDVGRRKILKPVKRLKVLSMFIRVTGRKLCKTLSKKR
jgi:clan AA aspartic protease